MALLPRGAGPPLPILLPVELPDVFEYSDYRRFLADHYRARKKLESGFSLRALAKEAGFPSHGLLKFLMEGKRNLSKKTLLKLSGALGLRAERARYFEDLVFFNQAKSLKEKEFHFRRLAQGAGRAAFRKLGLPQLEVFRDWRSIALREMLSLRGARAEAAWLASRLLPRTTEKEARRGLEALVEAGLIAPESAAYRPLQPDIATDDDLRSFVVMGYHRRLLELAAWAQEEIDPGERDISSACFTLRESDLPRLKARIAAMRKELREFSAPPGEGDRVVQVAIQMFPVTKGG